MKFQVNDRVLMSGHIYRVTGEPYFTGLLRSTYEVVPVELVSADGDKSICALKVDGLDHHQVPWYSDDNGHSWNPIEAHA